MAFLKLGFGVWAGGREAYPKGAKPPAHTPKSSFSPALGRESEACFAGLSDFERYCWQTCYTEGGGENVLESARALADA